MKPEVSVPWYRSVTVWIGLVSVLIAALQEFAGVFPDTVSSQKALAIAGVLTIVLRLTNSKPIQGTPKEESRVADIASIAEAATKRVAPDPLAVDPGQAGKFAAQKIQAAIASKVAAEVRKAVERNQ